MTIAADICLARHFGIQNPAKFVLQKYCLSPKINYGGKTKRQCEELIKDSKKPEFNLTIVEGVTKRIEKGRYLEYIKTKKYHGNRFLNKDPNYIAICVDGIWYEKSRNQKIIEEDYLKLRGNTP